LVRDDYFAPPALAAPKRFVAATGICLRDGVNESENLTLAARNALLHIIDLLMDRGWNRQQAYAICSVAADLPDQRSRRHSELRGLGAAATGHFLRIVRPDQRRD
jgi:hypothetical protein